MYDDQCLAYTLSHQKCIDHKNKVFPNDYFKIKQLAKQEAINTAHRYRRRNQYDANRLRGGLDFSTSILITNYHAPWSRHLPKY